MRDFKSVWRKSLKYILEMGSAPQNTLSWPFYPKTSLSSFIGMYGYTHYNLQRQSAFFVISVSGMLKPSKPSGKGKTRIIHSPWVMNSKALLVLRIIKLNKQTVIWGKVINLTYSSLFRSQCQHMNEVTFSVQLLYCTASTSILDHTAPEESDTLPSPLRYPEKREDFNTEACES